MGLIIIEFMHNNYMEILMISKSVLLDSMFIDDPYTNLAVVPFPTNWKPFDTTGILCNQILCHANQML